MNITWVQKQREDYIEITTEIKDDPNRVVGDNETVEGTKGVTLTTWEQKQENGVDVEGEIRNSVTRTIKEMVPAIKYRGIASWEPQSRIEIVPFVTEIIHPETGMSPEFLALTNLDEPVSYRDGKDGVVTITWEQKYLVKLGDDGQPTNDPKIPTNETRNEIKSVTVPMETHQFVQGTVETPIDQWPVKRLNHLRIRQMVDDTPKFYRIKLSSSIVESTWSDISGKPEQATRWPAWSEVTSKPEQATRWPTWSEVTSKPTTATRWPAWSEVTSKPTTATRWPAWSEVTDKPSLPVLSGTNTFGGSNKFYSYDATGSYGNSAIELRETNLVTSSQSAIAYSPTISFHWGGRVAKQLSLDSAGDFVIRNNNTIYGTLYHTGNMPTTATRWPTWSEVTSKPSTFAPSSHTHDGTTTTGAQTTHTTAYGYIQLGPMNTSAAHIYSNRGPFYMNQDLMVASGKQVWHTGNSSVTGNLSLLNGWTNYATSWGTPRATKTVDKMVVVTGFIKGGSLTSGTTIALLPSGMRPSHNMTFLVATGGSPSKVTININGYILHEGSGMDNTWFSLSGITFFTG